MGFYKTKETHKFFLMSEEKKTMLELKINGNAIHERPLDY